MANLTFSEITDRMPEQVLYDAEELLRVNANDSIDTALLYIYERRLRALLLRMDAEVMEEEIAAVVGTSTYQTNAATIHIIEVLYRSADVDEVNLLKTESTSKDNMDPDWRTADDATPEVWWNDELDPSIDDLPAITAEHFMVRPAPDEAGTLRVYRTSLPTGGALSADFLNPILLYEMVAQGMREMAPEQESEERADINQAVADFFDGLATLWEEATTNRVLL